MIKVYTQKFKSLTMQLDKINIILNNSFEIYMDGISFNFGTKYNSKRKLPYH